MKNQRKLRQLFYLFIIGLIFASCSNNGLKNVSILIEKTYPCIKIINYNKEILISPASEDKGSIGVKVNDSIYWITGIPENDVQENNARILIWNINKIGKVYISIKAVNSDIVFECQLENKNKIKPAEWFININANENEYFTGIFERVVDGKQSESWKEGITTALNLRGEKMDVKLKPTVSAYAPFYVSSENYGFYVYGTWPGVIDFCRENENTVQIAFEGLTFNFKIYTASSPKEIVQKHALETGPSIVPPDWAFGQWRWRDEHFNKPNFYDGTKKNAPFNTDIVEDVLMMSYYDIPFSAVWIDRPWGKGQRGFDDYKFDEIKFPQPGNMISWLNNKGIELMMWIGPFVMGEMADYAEENNYFLKAKPWYNSRQILMDFTNEEAVKWWGENGPGKLAKMGIKGFKLDRADGEKLMDSLNLFTSIGTSYRENYNDYPRQYVKAAHDAVKPVLGDDFILFPRAQYTGSAKYGGMWAGDTDGSPEGLRSAIIGMQRCAVMGYPLWGSDIGGYWGKFSHETTMRWIAFGCFSPFMETGPTNNLAFWSNPDEPTYDTTMIAVWRLYSKIRVNLVSYIKQLALEANQTGTPIVRPLFLEFPEQNEAWNDWQTYLLGTDILISAIWQKGVTKHKLYLPAGANWIDAWNTGNIYEGGKYIEVDAPVYKMPFFIREGAGIQFGDLNKLYEESCKIASRKPDLVKLENKEGWVK